MALTEPQAKVLGALSTLDAARTLTVRQLCDTTGLGERAVRSAVVRMWRNGLAHSTRQGPVAWRLTNLGWRVAAKSEYHDYQAKAER